MIDKKDAQFDESSLQQEIMIMKKVLPEPWTLNPEPQTPKPWALNPAT